MKIYKLILSSLIIITLIGIGVNIVQAENESDIILTWEADNFYPSDYQGKPKATPNSTINVSVLVIKNNQVVNTSNKNFVWLLDGKYLDDGYGKNKINFRVNKNRGQNHSITVRIKDGEEQLTKGINIPIKNPELIIDKKMPSNNISLGSQIKMKSTPYFFNIDSFNNIKFYWEIISNQKINKFDNIVNLNIGNSKSLLGKKILVQAWAVNKKNQAEFVKSYLNLKIND